jgi:class 3 adenylate cyclase
VTFLFCDVEGSTRLWEAHGEAMRSVMAVHDRIVQQALESVGGLVFATGGDGFGAAFSRAGQAVAAAVAAQRALATQEWPEGISLRVRMGLHTGEADERDGDYFGPEVSRAARLMAIAHGGQILCSQATADLVGGHLPAGVSLADMGVHRLRDLSEPLRVFQVVGDGLPSRFPPLLSMDAFPGNLPLQVSSFIGREVELARVSKALGEARVVTLTGVGGVGKTRLALRARRRGAAPLSGGGLAGRTAGRARLRGGGSHGGGGVQPDREGGNEHTGVPHRLSALQAGPPGPGQLRASPRPRGRTG